MFGFLNRFKLKKADLKGTAKLMYQDVSDDSWDKENLTKRNLDFTIESVRFIDIYIERLMNTKYGNELLNKYFDILVMRIGAYIGEVIKNNIRQDFYWYESDSVQKYSQNFYEVHMNTKGQSVLYSRRWDKVILPLHVVSQLLKGNCPYSNLLNYVEETIQQMNIDCEIRKEILMSNKKEMKKIEIKHISIITGV